MVFTDLDGTLLDHHTYEYRAALPGIEALKTHRIPLVMCTSKTLSECLEWQKKIAIEGPIVYENGAGIALPKCDFPQKPLTAFDETDTHFLCGRSLAYKQVRDCVVALRKKHGYDFKGYGDFSTEDVMDITGLPRAAAEQSRTRHHTEPLIWSDSPEAKRHFIQSLESAGFTTLQGGRFLHVTSHADKGSSMMVTAKYYIDNEATLIALGDSPNDTAMLHRAQGAVVIRRHDNSWMPYTPTENNRAVIKTQGIGPIGWSEAITHILTEEALHG